MPKSRCAPAANGVLWEYFGSEDHSRDKLKMSALQGLNLAHAIAAALARRGAATLLVSGPTSEPDPAGVEVKRIESAEQMLAACRSALPADIAVCAAAVADWRPAKTADQKIKKAASDPAPITLLRNPDILATLAAAGNERPRLVVGFAAEPM